MLQNSEHSITDMIKILDNQRLGTVEYRPYLSGFQVTYSWATLPEYYTRPLEAPTLVRDLNTRLVSYSDPHWCFNYIFKWASSMFMFLPVEHRS